MGGGATRGLLTSRPPSSIGCDATDNVPIDLRRFRHCLEKNRNK